MSHLERLLTSEPRVATAGIDLLAEGVESQGATVVRTDWRPPLEGTEDALAAITAAVDLEAANTEAARRLVGTHPHWTGMAVAGDVIPGMGERTFLHAGPPMEWQDCSGPMKGALIGAMIYEGLAATPEEAIALGPDLELSPCHHHQSVGPMAGVVSASMPVSIIEATYCPGLEMREIGCSVPPDAKADGYFFRFTGGTVDGGRPIMRAMMFR